MQAKRDGDAVIGQVDIAPQQLQQLQTQQPNDAAVAMRRDVTRAQAMDHRDQTVLAGRALAGMVVDGHAAAQHRHALLHSARDALLLLSPTQTARGHAC